MSDIHQKIATMVKYLGPQSLVVRGNIFGWKEIRRGNMEYRYQGLTKRVVFRGYNGPERDDEFDWTDDLKVNFSFVEFPLDETSNVNPLLENLLSQLELACLERAKEDVLMQQAVELLATKGIVPISVIEPAPEEKRTGHVL